MQRMTISACQIGAIEAGLSSSQVVGVALDLPAGAKIEPHVHLRGQLMCSNSGVMIVESGAASWVVWPDRAVWVPEQVRHTLLPVTGVSLRNVLIDPIASCELPDRCAFVRMTGLLRELVARLAEEGRPFRNLSHQERVMQLIVDEFETCPVAPVHLPLPNDPRLKRICGELRGNPADDRTLDDWAEIAGASSRTLSRLFLKETGLSFAHWRRQLRLISALALLGEGKSVTTAAFDVGYESPSAFIEMFKRIIGQTPGQYLC